jgi:hypothetical protein
MNTAEGIELLPSVSGAVIGNEESESLTAESLAASDEIMNKSAAKPVSEKCNINK